MISRGKREGLKGGEGEGGVREKVRGEGEMGGGGGGKEGKDEDKKDLLPWWVGGRGERE